MKENSTEVSPSITSSPKWRYLQFQSGAWTNPIAPLAARSRTAPPSCRASSSGRPQHRAPCHAQPDPKITRAAISRTTRRTSGFWLAGRRCHCPVSPRAGYPPRRPTVGGAWMTTRRPLSPSCESWPADIKGQTQTCLSGTARSLFRRLFFSSL